MLVNLHERAHEPSRLARYGVTEVHLPVADFTPQSPEQLDRGIAAIGQAIAASQAKSARLACTQSSSRAIPSRAPMVGRQPNSAAARRTSVTYTRWSPGRQGP